MRTITENNRTVYRVVCTSGQDTWYEGPYATVSAARGRATALRVEKGDYWRRAVETRVEMMTGEWMDA